MKQILMAIVLVVGFIVTGSSPQVQTVAQQPTAAQEEAAEEEKAAPPEAPATLPTIAAEVGHDPYAVELPSGEPLVVWAGETVVTPGGQFAKVTVFIQDAEGTWITLTPCDDIMITCDPVPMRIENVTQGEQFYLDLGGE